MFVRLEGRPRHHTAWVTLLVTALCMAVWVWQVNLEGRAHARFMLLWGTVPAQLFEPGVSWSQQMLEMRPLRLITALFIHAHWTHLLGNTVFLYLFGLAVERALGSTRTLVLLLGAGALANFAAALSLAEARSPIIGSSGMVSALVGAYLALFPRASLGVLLPLGLFVESMRIPAMVLIGSWFLLQVLYTFTGPSFGAVAWWAHVGGFMLGVIYALTMRPRLRHRWKA